LVTKPVGKRLLVRHNHKLEDNIKINLKGIGWKSAGWIHFAQGRHHWLALDSMMVSLRVLLKKENISCS
jgi:hypothetical protein